MKRNQLTYLRISVVVLSIFSGFQFLTKLEQSFRIAFALEQTALFEELENRAYEALNQSPPKFEIAEELIKGIEVYYPPGSKQRAGSNTDHIVERARSATIRAITNKIQCLKNGGHHLQSSESPVQP